MLQLEETDLGFLSLSILITLQCFFAHKDHMEMTLNEITNNFVLVQISSKEIALIILKLKTCIPILNICSPVTCMT